MSKKPRRTPSVENFGPDLLNTLIKGSRERKEFSTTYNKAVKFRKRVHELQTVMYDTKHPLYRIVARTMLTIEVPDGTPMNISSKNVKWPTNGEAPVTLIIQPHDSQFHDMLLAGGLTEADLQGDPLEDHDPSKDADSEGTEVSDLDAVLYGFGKQQNKS